MGEFVFITTLLTFSHILVFWFALRRGYKKGYEKGVNYVLDEWRKWLRDGDILP